MRSSGVFEISWIDSTAPSLETQRRGSRRSVSALRAYSIDEIGATSSSPATSCLLSAVGTPTMPLLLAARSDELVRAALAGGPLDGALVRVATTDAIARSREAALDYAARARSFLDSHPHREELEALTYAVVDRAG